MPVILNHHVVNKIRDLVHLQGSSPVGYKSQLSVNSSERGLHSTTRAWFHADGPMVSSSSSSWSGLCVGHSKSDLRVSYSTKCVDSGSGFDQEGSGSRVLLTYLVVCLSIIPTAPSELTRDWNDSIREIWARDMIFDRWNVQLGQELSTCHWQHERGKKQDNLEQIRETKFFFSGLVVFN